MTRYVLYSLAIPEEHFEVALGVLSLYPIIGVEETIDELTLCIDQKDWLEHYETGIVADLQAAGVRVHPTKLGTEDDQNWNAEWEKSIDPVIVNERIAIVPEWRAHEYDHPVTLVITPKMSFGTGHHATTRMMCRLMETFVEPGTFWIDVGTGTGVLAILAIKQGAARAWGFDNNEWSILNAKENVERNNVTDVVTIDQLELDETELPPCDGLAANLYRHLVIPHAGKFLASVKPGGVILVSGILKYDADEVEAPFLELGCTVEERLQESEWCAIAFRTPKG